MSHDLVPPCLRPHVTRLVGISALWVAAWVVAVAVASNGPLWPDGPVGGALYRLEPHLHPLTNALVGLKRPIPLAVISVLLVAVCALARSLAAAVAIGVSLGGSLALAEGIKHAVGEAPHPAGTTFPSGHATEAAAIAVFITLLAAPGGLLATRWSRATRAVVVSVVWLAAVAVSAAVVIQLAHRYTDVVAGFPLGAAFTLGVARIVDATTARWRRRAMTHPPPHTHR